MIAEIFWFTISKKTFDKIKLKIYNNIIIAIINKKLGEIKMKKLAKKLSVFALSSVILLSNSPIKAGMFAEGQTYDLGIAGTITVNNHRDTAVVNQDQTTTNIENFEVNAYNHRICIEIEANSIEVSVKNSNGDQLFHIYEEKDHITEDLVLKVLKTTLTNLGKTNSDEIIKKIDRLFIEDEQPQPQKSAKKPKLTTQTSTNSKKLAKPEDPGEETSEISFIASRTRRQTKLRGENISEIISPERKVRKTCTVSKKTKTKKTDKHAQEKKPKKQVVEPKHRKITYKLPAGRLNKYTQGHCNCEKPRKDKKGKMKLTDSLGKKEITLNFYPCKTCRRPIRRSRENSQSCWRTYCRYCKQKTEFYMIRGNGEKRVLVCCNVYPFKIHEIEYANIAEFNADVDRGQIQYICSENPNHTRAHIYKSKAHRATCLDCANKPKATRIVKARPHKRRLKIKRIHDKIKT